MFVVEEPLPSSFFVSFSGSVFGRYGFGYFVFPSEAPLQYPPFVVVLVEVSGFPFGSTAG